MTIDRRAVTPAALVLAAGLMTPAAAQNAQDAPPPPRGLESLAPQSVPVPPAPVIVLPTATPSADPATRETPRTRTARVPVRERARSSSPTPVPTPTATRSAEPTPVPAPTTAEPAAPIPVETPAAAPTASPAATPQAAPTIAAPDSGRTMPIWILPAVIVLVLAGLWALTRRRREPAESFVEPEIVAAAPEPEPIPAAPVVAAPVVAAPAAPAAPKFLERPVPAAPRARLTVEIRPLRAGLNLLSAVADCELVVTNTGDAPAEGIRLQVTLLTAHSGLDTDLAALTAAPIGRPSTPPFALASGETRTIKAIAATPRDAIRTMTAANRPMFVPIVSVNVLYPDGQSTRAWAIGIERVDSAKLAPFWLDAPAKMYADIGARPHAAAFER